MKTTRELSRWPTIGSAALALDVDVKHHIVRDAVEGKVVRVEYVKSGEQHADALTKALDVKAFEKHRYFLLNTRAS